MASSVRLDDFLLQLMEQPRECDTWEPGFEVGRCLVHAKAGPFERVYLRPPGFRRRFFHRLYPLPVDTWEIDTSVSLFGGLCTIEVRLRIRFQATLRYAEKNPECWEDLNGSVRKQMETLVLDEVEARLSELGSGGWIETGLNPMEKRLATAINETLTLNHVQCRTICSLKSRFADLAELDKQLYLREDVVRAIVDKQTESEQLRFRTERQRQEEQLRQELERIRFALHGSARKQAEEAEGKKKRLEEKQRQMEKLREIEQQLHRETLQHQSRLEQMVMEKQLRDTQKRETVDAGRQKADTATAESEAGASTQEAMSGHEEQLLKDLEWLAANKLREKEELIESLEERLRRVMSEQEKGGQLAVGHAPALQAWLDRLAQITGRLMFFFRVRK